MFKPTIALAATAGAVDFAIPARTVDFELFGAWCAKGLFAARLAASWVRSLPCPPHRLQHRRGALLPLQQADEAALGVAVARDVGFRGCQRAMTREFLDVLKAAADLVHGSSSARDERATAGVR